MQGATDTDAAHTITALRDLPQSRDISTNRQLQSRGAMQFSSSADAKEQQRAEITGHAASLHTPPGSAAKRGLQVFTRQHLPTTKRLFAHATAEMQQAWAPVTRVSNSAWPAADARSAHVSRLRHSTGELLTVEVSSSCMLYSDEQAWNATPGTSSLMKYLQGTFAVRSVAAAKCVHPKYVAQELRGYRCSRAARPRSQAFWNVCNAPWLMASGACVRWLRHNLSLQQCQSSARMSIWMHTVLLWTHSSLVFRHMLPC